MIEAGQPSRTALAAAAHRAAHQVLERGVIFPDPLAMRILDANGQEAIRRASADPSARPLRLFIAVRSRFAEDALAAATGHGLRQVVVLGAGLDTYAYRCTGSADIRIFEVDHPATQAWKRECLASAGIGPPPTLTFVPVDLARETLGPALERAGFDSCRRAFFTWLGVVPYLEEPSVLATLRYVASLAGGAGLGRRLVSRERNQRRGQLATRNRIPVERSAEVPSPQTRVTPVRETRVDRDAECVVRDSVVGHTDAQIACGLRHGDSGDDYQEANTGGEIRELVVIAHIIPADHGSHAVEDGSGRYR